MLRFVLATMVAMIATENAPAAEPLQVTGIQAVHRHGQTFVTWKDVAEGDVGAKFRYSLYRFDQPITAKNLSQAALCYRRLAA